MIWLVLRFRSAYFNLNFAAKITIVIVFRRLRFEDFAKIFFLQNNPFFLFDNWFYFWVTCPTNYRGISDLNWQIFNNFRRHCNFTSTSQSSFIILYDHFLSIFSYSFLWTNFILFLFRTNSHKVEITQIQFKLLREMIALLKIEKHIFYFCLSCHSHFESFIIHCYLYFDIGTHWIYVFACIENQIRKNLLLKDWNFALLTFLQVLFLETRVTQDMLIFTDDERLSLVPIKSLLAWWAFWESLMHWEVICHSSFNFINIIRVLNFLSLVLFNYPDNYCQKQTLFDFIWLNLSFALRTHFICLNFILNTRLTIHMLTWIHNKRLSLFEVKGVETVKAIVFQHDTELFRDFLLLDPSLEIKDSHTFFEILINTCLVSSLELNFNI